MMLGFTRRLSLAISVRLTQMVLQPNAPAPKTSLFFDAKDVTSLGLRLSCDLLQLVGRI
jgi:hypothetical protein